MSRFHRRFHLLPEAITFAVAWALCLVTLGGRLGTVDEIAVYGLSYNIAQRGALDIDLLASTAPGMREPPFTGVGMFGPDGHFYSGKGILPSLLAVPLIKLGLAMRSADPIAMAMLLNGLLTAVTAAVITRHLRREGVRAPAAIIAGIAYVAGSMAWAYSKRLFTEPAAALCVVLAYHWITGLARPKPSPVRFRIGTIDCAVPALVAGLAMGGAVAASYSNAVLLPAFVALVISAAHRRPVEASLSPSSWARSSVPSALVWFGLGLAVWAMALAVYNVARFGAVTQTGMSLLEWSVPYFSVPAALVRFFGLVLSPYRGFLLYNPIILIAVAGLLFFRRFPHNPRAPVWVALAGTLSYLAFFSFWSMWWGGYNWGPRFLLPILPVWVIAAGFTLDSLNRISRRAIRLVALAGCVVIAAMSVAVSSIGALSDTYADEGSLSDQGLLGPLVQPESLAASPLLTRFEYFQAVSGLKRLQQDGPEVWWRPAPTTNAALGQALSDIAERITPDSAIILLAPARIEPVLHRYRLPVALVGLAPDQVTPNDDSVARPLLQLGRLFLLTDAGQTDPGNTTERWLEANAFRARNEFFAPWRVSAFGTLGGETVIKDVQADFGGRVRAVRVTLGQPAAPGGAVALTVRWERPSPADALADLAWYAHLVDPSGNLVAQHDGLLGAGYGWGDALMLDDRRGILVPASAAPGQYHVRIGVYGLNGAPLPATGVLEFPVDVLGDG